MRGQSWWRYALSEDGAEIIHDALEEIGVTPVLDSGVDHFETDEDGHVTAAIDPNRERFEVELLPDTRRGDDVFDIDGLFWIGHIDLNVVFKLYKGSWDVTGFLVRRARLLTNYREGFGAGPVESENIVGTFGS